MAGRHHNQRDEVSGEAEDIDFAAAAIQVVLAAQHVDRKEKLERFFKEVAIQPSTTKQSNPKRP
jgi:hypothetical protein